MSQRVDGVADIVDLAGADLGRTEWMRLTQERVDTFADATDDRQWIHVDPDRAADGPFGGTIAHGYLTLALVIPMFNELLEIRGVAMSVNYGLNKVRFPAPARVGGRIRLHGTVADVERIDGGVQMTVDFTVELEDNPKPACVAQAIYRHYAS